MEKINKRSKKHPKNKKKNQPLKVVYIGNPIKFNTSVSQFRALVQELTGQDSDAPDAARFTAADRISGHCSEVADTVEVAVEESVHDEVTNIRFNSSNGYGKVVNGSGNPSIFGSGDPSMIGSFNDVFLNPKMIEKFPWGSSF